MYLPFDLICHCLETKWTISRKCSEKECPDFSEPLLYDDEVSFQERATVITDVSWLPDQPSSERYICLICCNGCPPAGYLQGSFPVVIIESPVQISKVLNTVQQCFAYFQDWLGQLAGLSHKNASLQDILNSGSKVLGNRVEVTDAGHVFVAASQKGRTSDRESRPKGFWYSAITPERFYTYKNRYSELRTKKKSFLWQEESPAEGIRQFPTICANLFDGNVFAGAVTVQPTEKAFQPFDLKLLDMLAPYVQEAFLRQTEKNTSNHIVLLRDVIHGIVMGHTPDTALLSHLSGMTCFTPDSQIRCLTIRLPEDAQKDEYGKYLKKQMLSLYPDSIVFIHDKALVVFVKVVKTYTDALSVETLSIMLSGLYTYAGISDVFSELSMARHYYHEAVFAMETAIHEAVETHVLMFSECSDLFIYENCSGELPKELLFPEGFRRLIEYDRNAKVSYVETLRVFLDSDRNAAKTAKELFISRNTLLTRLEKIEALLALDLDDPDSRFRINLCLRLMKEEH